jgi:hypothetical protein
MYLATLGNLYSMIGSSQAGEGLAGTYRGVYDLNTFTSDEAILPTRSSDWYDGGLWQRLHMHAWETGEAPLKNAWNYLYKVIVMANQAIYLEESMKYLPEDVLKLDLAALKDKIVFQVVNTKENQEMIDLCPHREFMDLTIVYRVIVSIDESGVSGFLITHDIADIEELSEKLLFSLAKKNTKKLFPFKSERIEETMGRMMRKWGACDKDIEESFPDMEAVPAKDRVYVVSNEYEFFGANALIYSDVIGKIVKKIGTDCYILPSSVHDLVVLSTDTFKESGKLVKLVRETNQEHVRVSDRLSDSVYRYSIVDGSIDRVTDPVEDAS